jgi:hypothetical protein
MLQRSDLTEIQTDAVAILQQRLTTALWSKPGSGKTVIALTAVHDMYPARCLILGTKRIIDLVWMQEAARWAHLQDATFEKITGTPQQREKKLQSDARYWLINYELLPWLIEALAALGLDLSIFDVVIFDELTKMGSPSSQRFKKIRKHIHKIPVRFGPTGTPRGNSMLKLWSQTWCTAGNVLDPTFSQFRMRYFFPVDDKRLIWVPQTRTEKDLRERMKPHAYATPPAAASKEARINLIPVALTKPVRKLYDDLAIELEVEWGGETIRALSPDQLRNKQLQIISGAVYHGLNGEWVDVHSIKLDALADLVEELSGEQLLIFYRFKHEFERIKKYFGKDVRGIDDVDAWLRGDFPLLAIHPASGAHGLNLHVGGASQACWYTYPDSQELWEQGNRRLARTGQKKEAVSHIIYAVGTRDEQVASTLASHGNLQDLLLEEVHEHSHGSADRSSP